MRFSQRIGVKPVKTEIQIGSMDNDLRVALWNTFYMYFLEELKKFSILSLTKYNTFCQSLWRDFFKLPLDTLGDYVPRIVKYINDWFFKAEWCEIYDFIEFVSKTHSPINSNYFREYCNDMMERELSGYRFVGDLITPITNENELREIEEAIEESRKTKLSGVNAHLKSALSKLSDRKTPDYRNSVKESISAVESISRLITGDTKATLGQALNTIERTIKIHGSLKEGFGKIYGYTSDEGGIRHSMLEETTIEFEDAKYMLVACSTFINYLIMKASKAGVNFI